MTTTGSKPLPHPRKTSALAGNATHDIQDLEIVELAQRGARTQNIRVSKTQYGNLVWVKVGSKADLKDVDFLQLYEADPLTQVQLVKAGVSAKVVERLAERMDITKDKLMGTLGLARATIQRKTSQQKPLSREDSSRVLGMSKLIGQVQAMVEASGNTDGFDAAAWVAQWLDQPLPALGGHRPAELMDTAEGQALVSDLLARLQSGAYA